MDRIRNHLVSNASDESLISDLWLFVSTVTSSEYHSLQSFSLFYYFNNPSITEKQQTISLVPLTTDMLDAFVKFRAQSKQESEWLNSMSQSRAKQMISTLPDGTAFVLVEGDSIVGQLFIEIRGKELYVQLVSVLGRLQGTGAGKRLMKHAEHIGRKNKCTEVTLTVARANDNAIAFYEHLGYANINPEKRTGTNVVYHKLL